MRLSTHSEEIDDVRERTETPQGTRSTVVASAPERCPVCGRVLEGDATIVLGRAYCSDECASSRVHIPGRYLG
jgi:hypothetical protein